MKKSEDCPKKTSNETTENKKTTGEMSQKQRKGAKGKNNIKKVRKSLLKQTDIAKSEDCLKKTANETTENKKTTGKIPKGKGRNVPKAKERGKGQKTI